MPTEAACCVANSTHQLANFACQFEAVAASSRGMELIIFSICSIFSLTMGDFGVMHFSRASMVGSRVANVRRMLSVGASLDGIVESIDERMNGWMD